MSEVRKCRVLLVSGYLYRNISTGAEAVGFVQTSACLWRIKLGVWAWSIWSGDGSIPDLYKFIMVLVWELPSRESRSLGIGLVSKKNLDSKSGVIRYRRAHQQRHSTGAAVTTVFLLKTLNAKTRKSIYTV